jgi:hypothetical protein
VKLSALIGLTCIVLAACQQLPAPVPGAGARALVTQTCDRNSSGSDFVSAKVFKLSASFDATKLMPPTQSEIVGNVTPADVYWNDLVAAFTAATPTFKDNLCSLDGVFVVQNTCAAVGCTPNDVIGNSWGFRQKVPQPKRYIATSATLWQSGSAPVFVDYENMRLLAALQRLDPNGAFWFNLPNSKPIFSSASPNTSAMTVLAVLAHEYGHVLWYDKFVVNPDGSPNPGGEVYIQPNSPALFCNGSFYTARSWSNINVPSARWINFGERLQNQILTPDDYAGLLKADLSNADFGQAGSRLSTIALDRDLAGTLAAFSPVEDFVEIYEWFQLLSANPRLTDLVIRIGRLPEINIVRWIASKPGVKRKMACFSY